MNDSRVVAVAVVFDRTLTSSRWQKSGLCVVLLLLDPVRGLLTQRGPKEASTQGV